MKGRINSNLPKLTEEELRSEDSEVEEEVKRYECDSIVSELLEEIVNDIREENDLRRIVSKRLLKKKLGGIKRRLEGKLIKKRRRMEERLMRETRERDEFISDMRQRDDFNRERLIVLISRLDQDF